MEMVGRAYNLALYRFGFNGKEGDNEVKGNNNQIDYGARAYDPRLAKWLSIDPEQTKTPSISPYNFVSNNPITRVDPSGRGDFYCMGTKIGTDGINDNAIYLVKDKDVDLGRTIAMASANGGVYKPTDNNYSTFIKMPPQNVREAMVVAIDNTKKPTSTDLQGNNHEEGGIFGEDKDGNPVVAPALPGGLCNDNTNCEIDVGNSADKTEKNKLKGNDGQIVVEGDYHTHGKNSSLDFKNGVAYVGDKGPSKGDIMGVRAMKEAGRQKGDSYVLDVGEKKVYVYDGNGTKATMPLQKFQDLVKSHQTSSSTPSPATTPKH